MAGLATLNANYSTAAALTINRWTKRETTSLWAFSTALLTKLASKKQFACKGHGYQWNVPVRYPVVGNAQMLGISDSYMAVSDPTEQGGWSIAQFTPAKFLMQFADSFYDMDAQDATTEMVSRTRTLFDQAKDNVLLKILTDIWAAEGAAGADGQSRDKMGSIRCYVNGGGSSTTTGGVTNAPRQAPSTDIGGLYDAVGTTPITKVGNIERNAVSGAYWCPQIYTPSSAATLNTQLLNRMINHSTWGARSPDIIYCGPKLFSYLQGVLAGQQRTNLDKYGFRAFSWLGIDVVMEQNIPEGTNVNQMFGLCSNAFSLYNDTLSPTMQPMRDVKFPELQYYQGVMSAQLVTNDSGICNFRHSKIADPA